MEATKRVEQVAVRIFAAIGLVVALPLIAVVALTSWLMYRTSPLFIHERVGHGGELFRLVKVRTLPPSVDSYADKYSLHQAGVPAVMRLIRRLHLDELPQLLHIVRGEMAFVGPRPEMPFLHQRMTPTFAAERVTVLPGVTGLWQVSQECSGLISECPEYDRFYIQHRSRALNLWILFRTLSKVVSGRTIQLDDVPAWALGDTTRTPAAHESAAS